MNRLSGLLNRCIGKKEDVTKYHNDGGTLVIDCSSCRFAPEPGSPECIGCMMDCLFDTVDVHRIVLRTGRDIEVSGKGSDALCQISSLRRWYTPLEERERRCRKCSRSRRSVMEKFWENSPDISLDFRSESSEGVMDEECRKCLDSTSNAIDRLETDLRKLIDAWGVSG